MPCARDLHLKLLANVGLEHIGACPHVVLNLLIAMRDEVVQAGKSPLELGHDVAEQNLPHALDAIRRLSAKIW
jgi:hypothetical protein